MQVAPESFRRGELRSLTLAFERRADEHGDAVAIEAGNRRLSYAQLDAHANRLAHRLVALGAQRGDVVGVLAERGPVTIVAALAALKAGCAYAPLDPENPSLRMRTQLRDVRVAIAVAPERLVDLLAGTGVAVVALDPDCELLAGEDPDRLGYDVAPDDLAAVIFTSGSTGRPKGVAIEHRNLLNLLHSEAWLSPTAGEGALHVCTPQFDVGAYEIWATLLAGARLVCHPPGRPDPREVCETVRRHDVTWAAMATGIFHQLVEHGPAPLAGMRFVLVGGEPLQPRAVRRFRAACPHTRLVNTYGPTETTVLVTAHEVGEADGSELRITIGRAAAGARLQVRDEQGVPVAPGAWGELWIGGPGVARGYLHRPELTAERFAENAADDGRTYRSGDIARQCADGTVELRGRVDDQLKLSGYRVEPREVEAQLATHPAVRRAVVHAPHEAAGRRRLVAYVVAETSGGVPDADTLRDHLAARLPAYMLPAAFVALERLPLTINGKVDRAALPPPEAPRVVAGGPVEQAPLTDTIARIFAEVLGFPALDPAADFLALGGNSLLAVQALARLREELGLELPLAAVFHARSAAALARLAQRDGVSAPRLPPLPAASVDGPVGATAGQAKALLIGELAEESLPYQSQALHRIFGVLDVGALERALSALMARHEILRTTFARDRGVWVQRVHEPAPVRLVVEDCGAAPDPERALTELAAAAFQVRIDPGRLPLVRYSLVRLAAEEHALIVVEHHVVHDGVTTSRFLSELAELYTAQRIGRATLLPAPTVQFRDFARWQAALVAGEHGERSLAHWAQRLAGAPAELALPLDRPRPARQTYRGETLRLTLPDALADAVHDRARSCGATPFALMLAAYCALLARYADADELVVGSGLANRRTLASEQLLGMVVNTVALRVALDGDPTMEQLVARVQEVVLDAQAHQDVPFERVVERLAPARSANAAPLYQAIFSFHDAPVRAHELPGAVLVPRDALPNGSAKADLNVVVIHRRGERPGAVGERDWERFAEQGLTIVWEYNSDLFERASAERMLAGYHRILEQVAREPGRRLGALALTTGEEATRSLAGAGRMVPYERDATLADVFAARAAQTPRAPALTFDGETLGYQQLDRRANRLANRLRSLGVTRGVRVGVCMERSLDLVVSFLAIAKAGGAYVPLDPLDPRERLRAHVETLAIPLFLSHVRHREQLPVPPRAIVCLDDAQELAREPDEAPPASAGALDPAYVMFTSGSTGAPKGVEVPHRAVVRLVRGADYVRLGPGETLLALAPAAFDASTFELWGALLNGGRLVLAPPGPLTPGELADLLAREHISTLWLTAGLFHRVVDDRPDALGRLRHLLAGGDVLSPDHVRRALAAMHEAAVLVNGYGPTEGTTFTCAHRMVPGDPVEGPVPIGRPIANTRVYLLDAAGQPVGVGVPGDLWIGGDGVALGYAGDPQLTAEHFRPDPFAAEPGARMYRSGDRARWRGDGTIAFLGRADRQLKIRGFRVEPGEVEEALRSHPDVADVHVAPFERTVGDRGLVAHVVARPGVSASDAELRAHAARTLPAHALPSAWSRLDRMPLTANGKLDAAALPLPRPGTARSQAGAAVPAPDTLERRLIAIWERVLEADGIGPEEDFFDLGGHSLLAVELFDAVERAFGRRLALATIFEAPTVRGLAAALREDGWQQPRGSLVTLTRTGSRPPLFLVAAGDGNSAGFGALARRLGPDQPLHALQPRGINGGAALHVGVERMAAHYLRAIGGVQAHGPYLLGGRCLGSLVAYEMARRLQVRGEEVALLVALDSGGPVWRTRQLVDGTPFDPIMNSALRRDGTPPQELGDVFSPSGGERLLAWLAEPVVTAPDGTCVTRYLHELYRLRTDVRDAFPDLAGADAAGFVAWAWASGLGEHELAESLLPPRPPGDASSPARRAARRRWSAHAGRIAWRASELADLVSGERRSGAAVRRRERVQAASARAADAYRAGPYGGVVTLIRSEEYRVQRLLEQWHGLDAAGVVERHVPGSHRSMLREPDVAGLATCLSELIDRALDAGAR